MSNFDDAGIYTIAISICSISGIVATLSMYQYQVSDQYRCYSESDYYCCRLITIGLSIATTVFAVWIFHYNYKETLVICGYLLYKLILSYVHLYEASLQIQKRLDYAGKCSIAEGIVSVIAFISSYYCWTNIVLSTVLMAIMGGLTYYFLMKWGYIRIIGHRYPTAYTLDNVKKLLLIGAQLLISGVTPIILTASPKIMLNQYSTTALVGIFGTLSAPTVIVTTLATAIFAPFVVKFADYSIKKQFDKIRKGCVKMIIIIFAFGTGCIVLSMFFAQPIFELMYGSVITPYVYSFNVLLLGNIFYSIGLCGIIILVTKKQQIAAAYCSTISLVCGILVQWSLISTYGFEGAILSVVLSYLLFAIIVNVVVLTKPFH